MGVLLNKLSSLFSYLVVLLAALAVVFSILATIFGFQKGSISGILFGLSLLLFSISSVWHFLKKARGSAQSLSRTDQKSVTQAQGKRMESLGSV